MIFIHDTRDQPGKHDNVESYLTEAGHKIIRSKMYVGDISILNDQSCCIDLKGLGLREVYSNLVQQHDRFKRECVKAQESGIKLIILVEERNIKTLEEARRWQNPRFYAWKKEQAQGIIKKPPVSSDRLVNMMLAMAEKYGVEWLFCKPDEAGKTVEEILSGGGENVKGETGS